MNKIEAAIGDTIKADGWGWAYRLDEGTTFSDSDFAGCSFYINLDDKDIHLAVNIKVTGKPRYNGSRYQSRCKIEFVRDGEPSTFTGGYLYHIASEPY